MLLVTLGIDPDQFLTALNQMFWIVVCLCRRQSQATLRAIGMTRGQHRRSLAVEALVISLVSGVAGVLLGMVFGWLGTYMVFATISTPVMSVDWTMTITVLLVAALAAGLASVIPARRAVSTPPVRALAEA